MNRAELKHRIKNAIILLTEGHPFNVGDLTFNSKDKHFFVTGWTICNELQNLTKGQALIELNEIKELFYKMLVISPELSMYIKNRLVEYCLGYDYGMGGIEICREIDGQIKWIAELKD